MELKELYAVKGELQTAIEISQTKLRQVNDQLFKALSEVKNSGVAKDKDSKANPKNVKPKGN